MARGENPYEAPRASAGRAIGVRSGKRAELRDIAVYQKGVLVCILLQLLSVVTNLVLTTAKVQLPLPVQLLISGVLLGSGLVATVFVFLLAIKVYSTGLGILMAVLAIIPCLGLIVLLLISNKATKVLRMNGHHVGLLGANLAEFPKG